jgi:hypothetical protein
MPHRVLLASCLMSQRGFLSWPLCFLLPLHLSRVWGYTRIPTAGTGQNGDLEQRGDGPWHCPHVLAGLHRVFALSLSTEHLLMAAVLCLCRVSAVPEVTFGIWGSFKGTKDVVLLLFERFINYLQINFNFAPSRQSPSQSPYPSRF